MFLNIKGSDQALKEIKAMDRELIFDMKTRQIREQMKELIRLREFQYVKEYKEFKNIFLDEMALCMSIICDKELEEEITKFIENEIKLLNEISENIILNYRRKEGVISKDGILDRDDSIEYKYWQQSINDYIRYLPRTKVKESYTKSC